MRTISTLLALLCVAPLIRTLAGPLDFWTRTLAVTNNFGGPTAAAYSNGRWVASMPIGTGTNATAMTFASDDGRTWQAVREQLISNLTVGNGLFVGIGAGPVIVSSSDGVGWISRRLPVANSPQALFYARGLFWCSVPINNPNPPQLSILLSSPDALTWSVVSTNARSGIASSGQEFGRQITYCHDRFFYLVSGWYGPDQLTDVQTLESFDGIDFRPNPRWPLVNSIAYLNGTWVGTLTTNSTMIAVSTNGMDWTTISPSPWWFGAPSLKVANGRFLVVPGGIINYFFESTDGMNWVDHEVDFSTLSTPSLRVGDVVDGPNQLLALVSASAGNINGRQASLTRLYLSQPLTNAMAPVLGICRQPALRLESGAVGSGYHIETADAPNMPWRRLATVYPKAFPFTFLAPEPDQPHRIYRAVARD